MTYFGQGKHINFIRLKIKSKKTGRRHKISHSDWATMIVRGEARKYDVVDYAEIFNPYECSSDLDYSNVVGWCQFIGSVRSGHTLVSQIINAHQDALISDELGATNLFDGGIDKSSLFHSINMRADRYYKGGNKTWINRYSIGHYQNKTKNPLIIGDKICGGDTTKFGVRGYLKKYMDFIGLPFRFIWVLREPHQHINGKMKLALGAKNKKYYTLESNIKQYKEQYKIAKNIEDGNDVLRIYLEELIKTPKDEITMLLNWLGLPYDQEHMDACLSLIFDKPHTHDVVWSDEQKAMISEEVNDYKYNLG